MVDQLRTFAAEVTRVARDVGTEGMLGGQADVVGVQGMWNDLTVNVNAMADNLTTQVCFPVYIVRSVTNLWPQSRSAISSRSRQPLPEAISPRRSRLNAGVKSLT